MSDTELTARARRKLETMALIHEIAAKQVQSHGLSEAKVEDIATEASISRRTFFNYFATKEDAVLGLRSPVLPEGARERFERTEGDLLTRIAVLSLEVIQTSTVPGSSSQRRKRLRRQYPELTQRFELRGIATEEIVRSIVEEHLSQDNSGEIDKEIDVLLSLATAVIRYAYALKPEIDEESVTQSLQIFKNTIRKRI